MPVNPIDYGRYGNQEMIRIFEEEFRHELWLQVEKTVAKVQAELGMIPSDAAQDILKNAVPEKVTLERTMEIENRTRHDIAALFEAIAEQCEGTGSRWVHFGLTSNDVKDTALGLQLKSAVDVLLPQIDNLAHALSKKAEETKNLLAIGRSHGQHAVPITYGLRFSVWLDEILRHRERVMAMGERISVGKIAGATGSHAAIGTVGLDLQAKVLTELGLQTPIATTQIIQRDRHAETILSLANMASSLDKFATDLRNLQRTEISETYEPFARGKQVGSSAMPHKRNPVTCEKITGIARYVRSLVMPALENVVSWEERDITHSSTERFVIPQAFILTDYLLRETSRVIDGLEIDEEAVAKNLQISNESTLSEYILTQLTKAGMKRPKAHEILRDLNIQAREKNNTLMEIAESDEKTRETFAHAEVDVNKYFEDIKETSRKIVEASIQKYKRLTDSIG